MPNQEVNQEVMRLAQLYRKRGVVVLPDGNMSLLAGLAKEVGHGTYLSLYEPGVGRVFVNRDVLSEWISSLM